jgi:hypothetical protein
MQEWLHDFKKITSLSRTASQVHREAWLLKQNPSSKLFRDRYFILHANTMFYYKRTGTHDLVINRHTTLARGAEAEEMYRISKRNAVMMSPTASVLRHNTGGLSKDYQYRLSVRKATQMFHFAFESQEVLSRIDCKLMEILDQAQRGPIESPTRLVAPKSTKKRVYLMGLAGDESQSIVDELDSMVEANLGHKLVLPKVEREVSVSGSIASRSASQKEDYMYYCFFDDVAYALRAMLVMMRNLEIARATSERKEDSKDEEDSGLGLTLCAFDIFEESVFSSSNAAGGRRGSGSSLVREDSMSRSNTNGLGGSKVRSWDEEDKESSDDSDPDEKDDPDNMRSPQKDREEDGVTELRSPMRGYMSQPDPGSRVSFLGGVFGKSSRDMKSVQADHSDADTSRVVSMNYAVEFTRNVALQCKHTSIQDGSLVSGGLYRNWTAVSQRAENKDLVRLLPVKSVTISTDPARVCETDPRTGTIDVALYSIRSGILN